MRIVLAALLASTLPLASSAGEAQVLPFGKFSARDGRPGPGQQWEVSDAQGLKLAQELNAIAALTPIVIDYEHQTLLAEKNGQPAPAAGWMKSFEWRLGHGLFASVEWTVRAKAHIESGEYRFISPVLVYEKATGKVTGVHNAALVNHPALLGMDAVQARLSAQFTPVTPTTTQEPSMDLLAALCAALAVATTTTSDQMVALVTKLKSDADGLAALRAKLGLDATADIATLTTAVVALKDASGKPDAATLTMVTQLQGQVAALQSQLNDGQVNELVDQAVADGKLLPAQKAWAIGYGKSDLAALRTFIAGAPKVAAGLGQQQTQGDPNDKDAPLADDAMAVCKAMGITPEQYKAAATA